jgi:hypothetical protein
MELPLEDASMNMEEKSVSHWSSRGIGKAIALERRRVEPLSSFTGLLILRN